MTVGTFQTPRPHEGPEVMITPHPCNCGHFSDATEARGAKCDVSCEDAVLERQKRR